MTTKTRNNPAAPQSDPVSDAAPGVRTEAEVVADEQAANDAAAAAAPPGATGDPAADDLDVPDEESEKLVHYVRESDGTVQSVNEGSAEHRILERVRRLGEDQSVEGQGVRAAHLRAHREGQGLMAEATPVEGQEPAVVETEDGTEHVGVLPASAALVVAHVKRPA